MQPPRTVINRDWIAAFYRERHRALAAYAMSLVHSRDEAEDLVHEVLAGMLSVGGVIGQPEPYAFRAIRNRAVDRSRRASRSLAGASPAHACGDALDDAHDWPALRRALDALSPVEAEVVVLHTRSGLSFPQIAAVLEEPVGTVSARYSRALASMRALLAKEESHG